MASAFTKTKMKALKESLAKKDWSGVEKNANDVLSFEGGNYNARVFLSLALFNLNRFDESEESYKKAIEGAPTQALARQGLSAFYEKRQRWTDYAWSLLELMQLFQDVGDAPKYAEVLQKLIEVRRSHGTRPELIAALSYLLPYSPTYPLLRTLPPAEPTLPLSTPYHSVQIALISPLSTLLEVLSLTEAEESQFLENEIKKRRQRLGGPSLSAAETRKQVQMEQMPASQLPGLYRAILDDPDASDREELRRGVERKLLEHLRTLLVSLPSSMDETSLDLSAKRVEKRKEVLVAEEQRKNAVRKEVEVLAAGMVLIGVPDEIAWGVVLDWSDRFGEWDQLDWRELERYCDKLPETGLTKICKATRRRIEASQPREISEDEEPPPPGPTVEEMSDIIEAGLVSSSESLVAYLLSVHFFAEQREWEATQQVSEVALQLLRRIEIEIGKALPTSRRTLESHLAIALTRLEPPVHHLRALRLLESLITTSQSTPPAPLLISKAFIIQHSSKWEAAVTAWDGVLADPTLDDESRLEAQAERGWCLFKQDDLEAAKEALVEVTTALEKRKGARDVAQKEAEDARSKAGLERPEGLHEGETTEEKQQRSVTWWRLAECYWEIAASDENHNDLAFHAWESSIRADPEYAPSFTSLGVYYRLVDPPNYDMSSKCFRRAFELDSSQEMAARFLAEEFAADGEWTLVEIIAKRVVEASRGKTPLGALALQRLAWAWKAIGGAEMNSRKYPEAIVAFQSALRGAPDDAHLWVKLGVAYHASGKHVAALKAFVRGLALDPDSWYAKYSMANVQREIGYSGPAIATLREILATRPDELGVRVVLAETCLAAGLEELNSCLVLRAEDSLVSALEEATKIIEGGTATRIAWKIVGDALMGLARMSNPTDLKQSQLLAKRLLLIIESQAVDSKLDAISAVTVASLRPALNSLPNLSAFLALAVLAYKMRVLLESQNEEAAGSAWFDLGVSLNACRNHLDELGISVTSKDDTLHQAIRCLKFALHKEPVNTAFWNALGVLSFDLSPRLSQHCFIKSIEYGPRSAIPWTNLGFFYIAHNDRELANEAFLKAQVLDPDWAQAWVGQATLADLAGHDSDATMLLEHAFSLGGSVPEADVGFATRAYSKYRATPAADRDPAAVALSAPLFAITRYVAARPTDVSGLHLNALLLEQMEDLVEAGESLEKAATLLEQMYEIDESPEVEAQYVIAQTNLGRIRLANEDYDGALAAFDAAQSLISIENTHVPEGGLSQQEAVLLYTQCKLGGGLAHFWLGDFNSAEAELERGIEDLENHRGSRRADLALAAARINWSEGEEDRALASLADAPDAFQPHAPLHLRLATQALAIVTGDKALLMTVSRVRNKYNSVKYDPEVTRLTMLEYLANNDPARAMSTLGKTLHASPWISGSRRSFTQLLIQIPPVYDENGDNLNLQIGARFIRTRGVEGELAEPRASRLFASTAVHAGTKGQEEFTLRLMEKSVYLAPWMESNRDSLTKVRKAVEGI